MLNKTILVLGATGKTGSRIVKQLLDQQVSVRLGSRSAEVPFDWGDDTTWKPALDDIHAVYIAYQPDLAVPGASDSIKKFVELAVEQGVKRLVLLSGRGEEEAQKCEAIVQASGIDWTILQCSVFAQNFSEGIFLDGILSGELVLPIGDVGVAFIDVDDIAEIASEALIGDKHIGKLYELTGSDLLSFEDATAVIAKATNRPIQFVQVPLEVYTQGLREMGLSDDFIWLIDYLFTTVMDGRNEYITDGVEQALGRKARSFASYVEKVASTSTWTTPSSITR